MYNMALVMSVHVTGQLYGALRKGDWDQHVGAYAAATGPPIKSNEG